MTEKILFLDGRVTLYGGDCRDVIKTLPDNSVDVVLTDPPYALVSIQKRFGKAGAAPAKGNDAYMRASAGFMGKNWDTGETAFAVEFWAEVYRVLKPGGHVAAFSGTRTYHRLAIAIEDAGFEIRDMLGWLYGSGFPKSHDVSKAIDKAAGLKGDTIATGAAVKRMIPGADQHKGGWEKTDGREYQPGEYVPATADAIEWQGFGTALKPSQEPICLGRKPLDRAAGGTVAGNVLAHGVGALNIDGCRVGMREARELNRNASIGFGGSESQGIVVDGGTGRFPANILHDGSAEVLSCFPGDGDGSAGRFFYTAKADADNRLGSKHPTVKPIDLMQWLCRLAGGQVRAGANGETIRPVVLDPFAGTGSTGEAAYLEGFDAILIERESEYSTDIATRMDYVMAGPTARKHQIKRRKVDPDQPAPVDLLSLANTPATASKDESGA